MVLACLSACALFQRPKSTRSAAAQPNASAFGPGPRGASHLIPVATSVNLGMGFASLTGEVLGHCIEPVETQQSGTNVDELEVNYAEDVSSLSNTLGVTAEASAEFGLFSVSAEAKYVAESASTRKSSFLVVRSVAMAPLAALTAYRLKTDALALLKANPQGFYRRCGDQFVAAVQSGATFSAIAKIESASAADRDFLHAHAKASYLGFGGGGGVDREVKSKLDSLDVKFHVIQSGRQKAIPSFDDFVDVAQKLNGELHPNRDNQLVRFEAKAYDVAENWPTNVALPALTEQAKTLQELAEWHRSLAMTLTELEEARGAPKTPKCPNRAARFRQDMGNLEATQQHIEARAHACVRDPMKACDVNGLARPPVGPPPLIEECSDLAARAKKTKDSEDAARRGEVLRGRAAAKCRGHVKEVCNPCVTWEFSKLTYDAPRRKPSGECWDFGCGAPDPIVAITSNGATRDTRAQDKYKLIHSFEPPLRLPARASVSISIKDQDASVHDRMALLSETLPERLPSGTWTVAAGALRLVGKCVE